MKTNIQQLQAHNKIIENQLAQIAQQVKSSSSNPSGHFPSSTVVNPKEQAKAITFRLRRGYEGSVMSEEEPQNRDGGVVDILSNKSRLEESVTISLPKEVSAIIQNKLPQKLGNPGSYAMPVKIGDLEAMDALCDLGESVSLMPYSIAKSLKVVDLKPIRISLQMADRTVRLPLGILEDVPVQVGRPSIDEVHRVDTLEMDLEEFQENLIEGDPLQAILTRGLVEEVHNEMKMEVLNMEVKEKRTMPPHKVELKPLPPLLKYAFLDDSEAYPVIVNAKLDDISLDKLLVVLKEYRDVIGYKIDEKG
ncbi:uncharacterized protein LOC110689103 [Chenopodium quinoa]|uniref:uncharacterized protein LOC110689103 n=1 Tax=Chenopodium quinoa TaxID=63459 RepID=UPI000B783D67|nr:uncharacterized protein LOC110689103 [Chenopodium quinoa]